jgi:hypothetical protein
LIRQALTDIALSGILAPSADNEHVFQIEIGDASIRLWPTKKFLANPTGHRFILGLISLGAVVQNMELSADALGFKTQVKWHLKGGDGPIAQLDFYHESAPLDAELAKAIPVRHTNRRMYSGPSLSKHEVSSLNAEIKGADGIQLLWLNGKQRRAALGMVWRAESERFLREELHDEIFSSIRFDLAWTDPAEYALPPGALEIEYPVRPIFKALRHWSLMRGLNWLGVHHLIGLRAGWLPCWQAPALAILTTTQRPESGAIAIGSAFQRVWLRAASLNLALQPLAASVVLPFQDTQGGASGEMKSRLTSGWQQICPGATPLMLFRIGRANRPNITAARRPLTYYQRSSD